MKQPDAKTRILEAARKLFAQQGFDGTSVKQICEAAEVNISLVSYYFGGKENVLSALFQTDFFDSSLFLEDEFTDDPILGIQEIARSIISLRIHNPDIMTILHREILNQTPRNSEIESYIYPIWNRLRSHLETGLAKGLFQFQSLDQIFQLVVSTIIFPRINPNFLKPLLSEDISGSEELINNTMEFILRGLGYSPDNNV